MTTNESITVRVPKELKDKLKAAAQQAGMPVSVFIRIVFARIVKQP